MNVNIRLGRDTITCKPVAIYNIRLRNNRVGGISGWIDMYIDLDLYAEISIYSSYGLDWKPAHSLSGWASFH